jgi:hypothetical protein
LCRQDAPQGRHPPVELNFRTWNFHIQASEIAAEDDL